MPLPTIDSRPEKTVNGFLSKWNAGGGKLPLIYSISNTKFPSNTEDPTLVLNDITESSSGDAIIEFTTNHAFVSDQYILIDGDVYNGVFRVKFSLSTDSVEIDANYTAPFGNLGTAINYYNNYQVVVSVYAGIDATHPLTANNPIELVSYISQQPNASNLINVDVSQYVKTKLSRENGFNLNNDYNLWADFYIDFYEQYELVRGTITESAITSDSSNVLHSVNNVLQFQNQNGGNLAAYVASENIAQSEALFLTSFDELSYFEGISSFDFSVVVEDGVFDLVIEEFDINGNLITTQLKPYSGESYGVYRLNLNGISFQVDTEYLIVRLEGYKTLTRDLKINIDRSLCITLLSSPTNLVAESLGGSAIGLSWVDNSDGESGFEIERSLVGGGVGFSQIATVGVNVTSYEDTGLLNATTYYYRVRAVALTNSDYSNEASATTSFAFSFQTNKNPSGSGANAFNPSVVYTGIDTPIWQFENGYEFSGSSIDDQDGVLTGLDGTVQTVNLIIEDGSLITSFEAVTDGLINSIDFSVFEGAVFDEIDCQINTGLTSANVDVDLSDGFLISFRTCNLVSVVTPSSSSAIVGTIDFIGNSISIWNRNNLVYQSSNIRFSNNQLTTFDIQSGDTFTDLVLPNNNISTADLQFVDMVSNTAELDIGQNPINSTLPTTFTGLLQIFRIDNTLISGVFDLSQYNWATSGGLFIELNNTEITGVIEPDTNHRVQIFSVGENTNWNQVTLDLTGITLPTVGSNQRTELFLNELGTLTTLSQFKTASGVLGSVRAANCDLTGVIDWSNYTIDGDNFTDINLSGNPSLTGFLISAQLDPYRALDFSGTAITIANAVTFIASLDAIPISTTSSQSALIDFSSVGYTTAEVNELFVAMDTQFSINNDDAISLQINVAGTNGAPDGVSGGFDGLSAVASLVTKNYTVITS